MNNKILLGSIIAVVILILVSFTGVVGYQTTSSTIAKASPLFNIRSRRAIDEESKDITCNYIGRGEETNIHLSSRIKGTEQVQKAIYSINNMDDRAFSKLVVQFILHLKYQEQMTGKEILDALQVLHNIRRNPNDLKYYDKNNIPIDETVEYLSCRWFPGCNIFQILIEITYGITEIIITFVVFNITFFFHCFLPFR